MSRFSPISALSGCVAAVPVLLSSVLLSAVASAHIHLLDPQPRYPDEVGGENKNCPCGVGTGGRSCTKPEERSDTNRSTDRATPLVGGSMMMVQLDEYVGHSGRYRVAFDPDGADLEDFNEHVLADIPDPGGSRGNTGNDSLWAIAAPLPNIDCENCTLQVIQMMNGDTLDPVLDPVGKSTYYQCADLVLTRDTSKPEGYAEPLIVLGEPVAMASDTPDRTGSMAAMAGGTMTGMTGSTTPAPMNMMGTTTPVDAMDSSGDSGGGCSLGPARGNGSWPALGLAAASWLYLSRRRRSQASAAPARKAR
jgi:hypothetical protein